MYVVIAVELAAPLSPSVVILLFNVIELKLNWISVADTGPAAMITDARRMRCLSFIAGPATVEWRIASR
jgi:hypothetical protein